MSHTLAALSVTGRLVATGHASRRAATLANVLVGRVTNGFIGGGEMEIDPRYSWIRVTGTYYCSDCEIMEDNTVTHCEKHIKGWVK